MNTPKQAKQLENIDAQILLTRAERAGKYTVHSGIRGMGYVIENGQIGIVAGKNGMLSVYVEMVDELIDELKGIKELAEYRRIAGIKNA